MVMFGCKEGCAFMECGNCGSNVSRQEAVTRIDIITVSTVEDLFYGTQGSTSKIQASKNDRENKKREKQQARRNPGPSVPFSLTNPRKITLYDRMSKDYWVDKYGSCYYLRQLSDSHLINIIRMLITCREVIKNQAMLEYFCYPSPSGDAACDAYDFEMSSLDQETALSFIKRQPLFKKLMRELCKRGLEDSVNVGE